MGKNILWILIPAALVLASMVSASSVADSDLSDATLATRAKAKPATAAPPPSKAPTSKAPHPFAPRPDSRQRPASPSLADAADEFAPVHGPALLESFFEALERAESPGQDERVSIVQLGDSHTASDGLSGQLRRLLQQQFGAAGRGYAYPGRPWRGFRQENMNWGAGGGWKAQVAHKSEATGTFGLGGVRLDTYAPGAWLERSTCTHCEVGRRFDAFAVHYLRQPGGGRLEVQVEGRPVESASTDGSRGLGVLRGHVGPGAQTLRVVSKGGGKVSVLGVRTLRGEDGVEYASLGLNGATAMDFTAFQSNNVAAAELRVLAPDLVIVALGTNGAYNLYRFADKYSENVTAIEKQKRRWGRHFRRLLQRSVERAGGAACLVVTPPDLSAGPCRWVPEAAGPDGGPACVRRPEMFDHVVQAQKRAAGEVGCAVWDQAEAMGGPGSIEAWAARQPQLAQNDGKHLTLKGYHMLGSQLYADLTAAYRAWKKGRSSRLQTRRIDPR